MQSFEKIGLLHFWSSLCLCSRIRLKWHKVNVKGNPGNLLEINKKIRIKERLYILCQIFYYSRFISKPIENIDHFISVGLALRWALLEAENSGTTRVILLIEVVDITVAIHLRIWIYLWNDTIKANTSPKNKEERLICPRVCF